MSGADKGTQSSKRHVLVENPDGTRSLQELRGGQRMHSWIGPWAEANLLYVEPAEVGRRCAAPGAECVVYDVGCGMAANALALIERHRQLGCPGKLRVVSFENDLDGLRTALAHRSSWDFVERNAEALEALLAHRFWSAENREWTLLEGDFRARVGEAPPADLLFWDFYDPKTCPGLWDVATFDLVRRGAVKERALLLTYSAATPVRLGLVLAGFYVGRGPRTPVKGETTQAATRLEDLADPLGPEWIEKLRRSAKASPYGEEWEIEPLLERILASPQFR